MDAKYEIELLISSFDEPYKSSFNTGIITHINRAEVYFDKALSENDEMYYTDVIYRCNHAYEGILKEAYAIFKGKDSSKLTPDKIEKDFFASKLINDRLKNLFSAYRHDWRNPSTHEYKLFFSKEEAFVAIHSVYSFVYILLSQLSVLCAHKKVNDKSIKSIQIKGFNYKAIIDNIINFSKYLKSENIKAINEFHIVGYLSAYLEKTFPNLLIKNEFRFNGCIADIVIFYNNKIVCLIEVKRGFYKNYKNAYLQAQNYVKSLKSDFGIVYIFSEDEDIEYDVILDEITGITSKKNNDKNKVESNIAVILPKKNIDNITNGL